MLILRSHLHPCFPQLVVDKSVSIRHRTCSSCCAGSNAMFELSIQDPESPSESARWGHERRCAWQPSVHLQFTVVDLVILVRPACLGLTTSGMHPVMGDKQHCHPGQQSNRDKGSHQNAGVMAPIMNCFQGHPAGVGPTPQVPRTMKRQKSG